MVKSSRKLAKYVMVVFIGIMFVHQLVQQLYKELSAGAGQEVNTTITMATRTVTTRTKKVQMIPEQHLFSDDFDQDFMIMKDWPPESNATDDGGFYLITMFAVFNGNPWPPYDRFPAFILNQRDKEYLDVLVANAKNQIVKEIHLFYTNTEDLKLLGRIRPRYREKIVPVLTLRKTHMSDFFLYASKYLVDKPVIALSSDIVLAKGFSEVNTTRLREERVIYSLSRQASSTRVKGCRKKNECFDSKNATGSYDTYVFRLKEPLNKTILKEHLHYPINTLHAANGLIWTMRNLLNYTIRNPCPVLVTYHHHCTNIHGPRESSNYSILSLPHDGWNKTRLWQATVPVEQSLRYGL